MICVFEILFLIFDISPLFNQQLNNRTIMINISDKFDMAEMDIIVSIKAEPARNNSCREALRIVKGKAEKAGPGKREPLKCMGE